MDQEQIRSVFKEKVDELSAACRIIDKDFDQEAIHTFRTTMKSLRSFIRLLNTSGQKKRLKIPEKIKRLYHIAGAVREAQLELDTMAGKQAALPHYFSKLHLLLERQKKEWGRHYSQKRLQKFEDRLTGHAFPALNAKTLGPFFKWRMRSIDELGKNKPITDNEIHRIRKLAKDIIYTSKIMKKKCPGAKELIDELPMKQLDGLASAIGDYNDKRITRERLGSFSSRTMGQDEVNNTRAICDNYVKELKTEKKQILLGIKALRITGRQPAQHISTEEKKIVN